MWFTIENNHVQLRIFAKPNAKKTRLVAIDDQAMHIALHAKPQEGEANKVLIEYLAKLLKIPKSQIVFRRGEASRHKTVLVPINDTVKQLINNPDMFI